MICKVDNLKWIKAAIKKEVKEKFTDGVSPKKLTQRKAEAKGKVTKGK